MKRILITGMSGTGKSTVIEMLTAQGYAAVDLDSEAFSEWAAVDEADDSTVEIGRDWVWREDRVQALLSSEDADTHFMSGCAPNMGKFRSQFDHVILLSAPQSVILQRLATRTNNAYGKRVEEAARVLDLIQTVEPLLRKVADYEIDTSAPLDEVVTRIIQIVQT